MACSDLSAIKKTAKDYETVEAFYAKYPKTGVMLKNKQECKMIVNCTKQDIMVINPDGERFHIPPSGIIPWLEIEKELVAEVEVGQGVIVPIYRERLVNLQNIPDEEDGTWYIVSAKDC